MRSTNLPVFPWRRELANKAMAFNTGMAFRRRTVPAIRINFLDHREPVHDERWERSIRYQMLIRRLEDERRLREARFGMLNPIR